MQPVYAGLIFWKRVCFPDFLFKRAGGVLLIITLLAMIFFLVKGCKNGWFSRCWGSCCSRMPWPPEHVSISPADLETKIADLEERRTGANNTRYKATIDISSTMRPAA